MEAETVRSPGMPTLQGKRRHSGLTKLNGERGKKENAQIDD